MANIDIEKKEGGSIWPWILGLLLLVAVLAFIFWPRDNDPERVAATEPVGNTFATDTATAGATESMAQPVSSYVTWAGSMPKEAMGLDHEFTRSGLIQLADALAATAEKAPNVNREQFESKLSRMRTMANEITDNWESTQHADKIKKAFQASVDVFAEIQQSSFPNMDQNVASVRQTVEQLNPQTLTLDQKDRVKAAFRESADLLAQMNQNIGS